MTQWLAFEAVEGSLGTRGDWERTALIASILAEANRNTKARAEPFRPQEFLPWIERPRMTPAVFRAMFAGRIRKKEAKG